MTARIRDCWCIYCGHLVLAEGVSIYADDDYDQLGKDRDRCPDAACESATVATYLGDVLAAVEAP